MTGEYISPEQAAHYCQTGTTLDTTVDEWRAEMERLTSSDPGMTMNELRHELGLKRTTMQARIEKLIESKRCIKGKGTRLDSTGREYSVTVYQLTKEVKR